MVVALESVHGHSRVARTEGPDGSVEQLGFERHQQQDSAGRKEEWGRSWKAHLLYRRPRRDLRCDGLILQQAAVLWRGAGGVKGRSRSIRKAKLHRRYTQRPGRLSLQRQKPFRAPGRDGREREVY